MDIHDGGWGEKLGRYFLSKILLMKYVIYFWPVGGSRGFSYFIGSTRRPVSYILSAFRMGAADISCVYRGVSLDCFCISCIRSSSRMYIVIVAALLVLSL